MGRRGQQDQIYSAVNNTLECIEAHKPTRLRYVHPDSQRFEIIPVITSLGPFAKHLVALVQLILEQIAHRPEFDRCVRAQQYLSSSPGAAPAATDQSDLDGVVAGGVKSVCSGRKSRKRDGGTFDKISAGQFMVF